jgi:putative DNA primase/helicase
MEYDGRRWVEDSTLRVFDRARAICRKASAELPDAEKSTATRLAAASTIAAVERIVKSDRRHAATVEQWDPNAWVLNTPAGTVDLTTGGIRAFKRDDYLTKITAASPAGDCPLWRQFLQRITDGSAELQNYLQRVVGYCLTGSTREHVILFGYGTGANGKSVAINTIMGMMGDYATSAPASTFTVSRSEEHPTGIAGLRGARFVSAIETEDGHFWAESKIKSLTGGDRVTARFMRQDFFTFTPEFKLLVAGNHKPGLRNVDEAMRRRLHLIPFTVTIPEQERDHQLTETLRAEWGGILRWAIDGCLLWQRQGLNPPAIVRDATSDYLQAEDALGRWLEEQTTAGEWSSGKALFADWQHWCEQTGERAGTQKRFTQSLIDHGIKAERTREARGFSGIVLKSDAVTHVSRSNIIGVTHAHA